MELHAKLEMVDVVVVVVVVADGSRGNLMVDCESLRERSRAEREEK